MNEFRYFAPPFLFALFEKSTWDSMIKRYVLARLAAFKISFNRIQGENVGNAVNRKHAMDALEQLCRISPAFLCKLSIEFL